MFSLREIRIWLPLYTLCIMGGLLNPYFGTATNFLRRLMPLRCQKMAMSCRNGRQLFFH